MLPVFVFNGLMFLRTFTSAIAAEIFLSQPTSSERLLDLISLVCAAIIFSQAYDEGPSSNIKGFLLVFLVVCFSSVAGAVVQRFAQLQISDKAAVTSQPVVLSFFGMLGSGILMLYFRSSALLFSIYSPFLLLALTSHVILGLLVAITLRRIGNLHRQVSAVISTIMIGIFEAMTKPQPISLSQITSFMIIFASMTRFILEGSNFDIGQSHRLRIFLWCGLVLAFAAILLIFPLDTCHGVAQLVQITNTRLMVRNGRSDQACNQIDEHEHCSSQICTFTC